MTLTAPPVEDFPALLHRVFNDQVKTWTAEAEASEHFPRQLIEYLGREGVFAAKWGAEQQPAGQRQGGEPGRGAGANRRRRRSRLGDGRSGLRRNGHGRTLPAAPGGGLSRKQCVARTRLHGESRLK